jgi:lysophospholipase L1-like esterase
LTYRQAMYTAADALGIPLIDLSEGLDLRTAIIANGLNFDGVHLDSAGYATAQSSCWASWAKAS